MKKTLWIAIVGALAASVIAASAQEVLSANAVGYIKKTLPASGKLVIMGIPLDSMTDTNIVFGRTSVAQEAPVGSFVYFWDSTLQSWLPGSKTTKGWGASSNRVVSTGEGFFLKGDPLAASDFDVTITGEVPADEPRSRTMPGSLTGLGTLVNPYPVDIIFGQTSLASNATVGSFVYFWDSGLQSWLPGSKTTKGWGAFATRPVLAGEGFFMKEAGTNTTWVAAKPYTWPK